MGFLDELKGQAASKRQQELEHQQKLERQQAFYQKEIHPRMQEIYRYLNEMTDHLNYINEETVVSYPVKPEKVTHPFYQRHYKVTIDSARTIQKITLKFSCELDEPVKYEVMGKEPVQKMKEWLNDYKIKYTARDYKDDSYELVSSKFTIEGPINVSVYFSGDMENGCVHLYLSNFESPGVRKHVLQPYHINQEFLDKFARFLLRKDDKFMNLDITDTHKQTIREKVEEERLKREQELLEAERQAEEEANKKRAGILNGIFNKDK